MAVDSAGNLYFADIRNSRVRRIGTDGMITTVAGSSPFRFAGDGGPATEALLSAPISLAASPDGSVHVLERDNCRVRTIGPEGTIRTIAGNGICISGVDPRTSTQSETATAIGFGGATAVAADRRGNVYVADARRIRVITPDGQIRSIVNATGQPGPLTDVSGPAIDARISSQVFGLYVDGNDNLYFSDMQSNRVRKVTPDGMIGTFAGSGPAPGPPVFAGDGGAAVEARLSQPTSITGDAGGNIYVLDAGNRRIRRIGRDGVITTVAGSGSFGFFGDGGLAVNAGFNISGPFGFPAIAVDSVGNIYLADQGNHRIRRITPDGIVTTIAGKGETGFGGDGGPPDEAAMSSPTGLVIDSADNLYVSDSGNHRIRKVTGANRF
jgi:sugar lactone lactonase YvrE